MRKFRALFAGVFVFVFLARTSVEEPFYDAGRVTSSALAETASLKNQIPPIIDPAFGKMPLYFIRNKGQVDSRVSYYIQGKDKTIYFTSQGLTYVLSGRGEGGHGDGGPAAIEEPRSLTPHEREERSPKARSRWVVKLDFVGAHRDVRPSGEEKTEGIISYFRGSPQEWKTGLPTYSRIAYRDLWPGIDLVYHGTTDRLKYEFIVHPGADPARIRLAYRGADTLKLNEKGRLKVETPAGGFEDDVPEAWQEVDGKTAAVAIAYELEGQEYGFQVGDYDRAQILALDPAVLVYCGYIGGGSYDYGYGIAVDGTGNAYVTGYTASTEDSFPVSAGPDLTYNGSADAFVVKVNSSGTALVYCGYIGGSDLDYGSGIAVDGAGNAYVTGTTASTESTFPVTAGPDLTYNGGWYDAFVAKVDSSGTMLSYCGYIGGSDHDHCFGIAVDIANSAYVTGYALSTEATFPVLAGPDLTHNGSADAFVAKVGSSGTALSYCGYIGGSDDDYGNGIALDSEGNAHVTGSTDSSETTFPVALGPDLTYNGGSWDAYVATVNSTGTALRWCGYIGGSEFDEGHGIAADSAGNAYITGTTGSDEATFPVAGGPDLTYNGGTYDVFVAKVESSGTTLSFCGYIGGSDDDYGNGIAVDSAENAYIVGNTDSAEASFPVAVGPDLTYNGGLYDAFVAKTNSSGAALSTCGYIGGSSEDNGQGIAIDDAGNAYVTGYTESGESTFPVKTGPDLTDNGNYDVFVAKISTVIREDLLGTWDSSGVWYRNTETGGWVNLSSAASLVSAGDIDNDGSDDLIGVWGTGLWVRYTKSKTWVKLSANLPTAIASGDMNGDGRDDVVGSWTSGVWYRNSATAAWISMSSSPASLIAAGYIDGDIKEDLIGVWSTGLFVKNSSTGGWTKLGASLPTDIASGDMNGDGRDDAVGSWASGVWYRDSLTGGWVLMSSSAASLVAAGEIDGDSKDDLVGVWASGFWVKKSSTGAWMKISSTFPRDIDVGLFRNVETGDIVGFASPVLVDTDSPGGKGAFMDLSDEGPGGWRFRFEREKNLVPFEGHPKNRGGPGDPGFRFEVQDNLVPTEDLKGNLEKGNKTTKKKGI